MDEFSFALDLIEKNEENMKIEEKKTNHRNLFPKLRLRFMLLTKQKKREKLPLALLFNYNY